MKLILTACLLSAALSLTACGGAGDRSAQIASEIGAAACAQTPYEIILRVDNSKTRIYDCTVHAKQVCVTESGGIVSDQTAVVRLLFANALSGGKPACLDG